MEQLTIFDLIKKHENTVKASFFNTISAKGEELKTYREQAKSGEAKVMAEFEKCPKMTSVECSIKAGMNLNSCRRAMTVLSQGDNPKLVKLEQMKLEQYGKPNHYYKKI